MARPPFPPGSHMSADNPKTLLANVRIFDGTKISLPTFVVIDGDKIGTIPRGARVVDCKGGILIPGLIDSHVHLHGKENLEQLRQYGITTCLDMECFPPELLHSLRDLPGLPDVFSAGFAAYYQRPGQGWPPEGSVPDPEAAHLFVANRVAEGADFIKMLADPSGPTTRGIDQPSLNMLVATAKQYNLLSIAHAMSPPGFKMAQDAGVDIVTHAPLAQALDGGAAEMSAIARMVSDGRVCVPTLTMMEGVDKIRPPGGAYVHTKAAVDAMHKLGVPILAGTDCNKAPGAPVSPEHGESLHHELELLVGAGLSNLEALRAATVLPAKHFRLPDRGVIAPGMRADLVLLGADPLQDIKNTRSIQKVWLAGQMFDPSAAA
ncbi:hypothetical protein MMC13_008242 [Lambiella insularis]|nr:hypothetical protein [Lambiella insularis]